MLVTDPQIGKGDTMTELPPPPGAQPLAAFKSHIEGKNADVTVWPDRIEWAKAGGMSKGKVAAAALTGGMSLAATRGVKAKHDRGTEVIPVKSISSVTTEKDGLRYTKVRIITTGNTIDFRVGHGEADGIKNLLVALMLGNHPSQQAASAALPPPALEAAPPPPPATAVPAAGSDRVGQLRELAQLRDDGILTDDEFQTEKTKLLG